jgi:hypothetical protein
MLGVCVFVYCGVALFYRVVYVTYVLTGGGVSQM